MDRSLSTSFYMIHDGIIKLYADNGLPFKVFKKGSQFGQTEMVVGIRRNGTARA